MKIYIYSFKFHTFFFIIIIPKMNFVNKVYKYLLTDRKYKVKLKKKNVKNY